MDSSLNPWFSIFGMKWFIIVLMWTKRTRAWKTHTYPNQKNRGKIGIWILTVCVCVCFFMALRHCWINFPLRTTHCHWKSFWIQMFIQTMQKHRSHSPTYSFALSSKKQPELRLQEAGTSAKYTPVKYTRFICLSSKIYETVCKNYQEGCDVRVQRLKGRGKKSK